MYPGSTFPNTDSEPAAPATTQDSITTPEHPAPTTQVSQSGPIEPAPTSSEIMAVSSSPSPSDYMFTITESVPVVTDHLHVTGSIATFSGGAILTGSCTSPVMALATDSTGSESQYPWVGCSAANDECCPFNIHAKMYLTVCPEGYSTTNRACCPT